MSLNDKAFKKEVKKKKKSNNIASSSLPLKLKKKSLHVSLTESILQANIT